MAEEKRGVGRRILDWLLWAVFWLGAGLLAFLATRRRDTAKIKEAGEKARDKQREKNKSTTPAATVDAAGVRDTVNNGRNRYANTVRDILRRTGQIPSVEDEPGGGSGDKANQ